MTPEDLLRSLLDPTAPLPAGWPGGAWGAFMLFLVPIGGGIPAGVLMARAGGVSPLVTALMYLASDVIMAFFVEPFVILMRRLSERVPLLRRIGERMAALSGQTGLREGGKRGPLGLILVSLTFDPMSGRAAAAAAGHGFVAGWTLAIIGDMLYFTLLMVSTLWISSFVDDQRVTLGAVLLGMWLVPLLVRRVRAGLAGRAESARDVERADPPVSRVERGPRGPLPLVSAPRRRVARRRR